VIESFTIGEAGALLARRELSVFELVDGTLRRLDETEPLVHAYAHVQSEAALDAARRADRERSDAPLYGIPFAVKDVLTAAGVPTEAGSRLLAGYIASVDATTVRRLKDAGAILLGKHVTHELACGQDTPPTRNPWDLGHYPGGSSAGGGVSVAVGSSLAAIGTDAGGSVRKPAAVTGVVGLKPTFGRISGFGTIRLASAPSLDHVGIFTRTVEDCALVLQAIAGPDPFDRRTLEEPVPDYLSGLAPRINGIRLGIARDYFFGNELDSEVGRLVEDAISVLERLGARLVTIELPSLRLALAAGFTIFMSEVAASHRHWIGARPDDYTQGTRRMLELGLVLPAAHLEAAQHARGLLVSEVRAAFRRERLDALVTPTLPMTSISIETMVPALDIPKFIPYTLPWNLTGQPALTVPCGFTSAALPAGLQIIGRPLDEPTVLAIGHAYERATPWHGVRPDLSIGVHAVT
jgi:aspartyl-tRNA(Asn)/glutamyl-tRNA(Gln) amidotransferase subunit A